MKPNTHTVLHDPYGFFGADLPLDRAPYERLVTAVLSWTDPATLSPHDYEQIALQLTGHARAVATDVRRHTSLLDDDTGPRALAEIILAESQRRLNTPHKGTLLCVQNRARLVRALYEPPRPPPGRTRRPDRVKPPGTRGSGRGDRRAAG
nr:restriction endonuclease [Streptomyces sp. TSRI0281]